MLYVRYVSYDDYLMLQKSLLLYVGFDIDIEKKILLFI